MLLNLACPATRCYAGNVPRMPRQYRAGLRHICSKSSHEHVKNLRNNPRFNLSTGGAILDDKQRLRILKNVMVRFSDIAPEEKVVHLVVDEYVGESTAVVKRGWLYK